MKKKKKDILFWERFRPNTLKPTKGKIPIILLPRIKRLFEETELKMNYCFHGSGGTGKTTLAKIITQNTNVLKLNGSKDGGKDMITSVIEEHCRLCNAFAKDEDGNLLRNAQKVVWIEEFEYSSAHFRAALRSFMEEYRHVRFIITLNNITKINKTEEDKALLQRFNIIQFDPKDKKEEEFLKEKQLGFLHSIIKGIRFEVSDEILSKLIGNTFPCFRKTMQLLQELYISKNFEEFEKIQENKNKELYDFILNGHNDTTENFEFVLSNYGDNEEQLLQELGRPFFKYLMNNRKDLMCKTQHYLLLRKTCDVDLKNVSDPSMCMINFITQLKELINK